MNTLLILTICATEAGWITAYNVDTSSYRVLKGPKNNSYFGYTVASARINGNLTIWSGSPKLGPANAIDGGGKEGGIYHCKVAQTASDLLQHECERMNLKIENPNRKENSSEGPEDEDAVSTEELIKCSFEDGFCNFTVDHPQFWVDRSKYYSIPMRKLKYNSRNKVKVGCYRHIKLRQRLTGPPVFTVHGGMLVFDADEAVKNLGFKENITTRLASQTIEARSGKTQCLRFCFNAFSLLDYDESDESVKSSDWYTEPKGRNVKRPNPERSLRVYLQYDGVAGSRDIFSYRGPRDKASQFWNFTEINLEHEEDGSYKIYFEVTIVRNRKKGSVCSVVSDIALTDITLSDSHCHAETDQIDSLEEEQSIGMTLDVNIVDSNASTITTCGPLWQQNCGFAKEAAGVCYEVQSNSSQPKVIKNPGLKGCIRGKMDVVLLVDQSGSVNQCNFQKVKHWLRSVVRGFAIGPNQQDIGIVIYSHAETTRDVFELGFEKYGNSGKTKKRIMLDGLLKLPYEAGKTFTGVAFKHANDMLWGPSARKEAKKMIILLTDGATTVADQRNLQNQSEISRTRNATILTVGVAKYNRSELISISGDEKNFFSAKDFSELEKIRDTLRFSVSHSNLEGSRRSKSMQNCQMGFSMYRGKNELLLGAPGCFDRAGDVMRSVSPGNKNNFIWDEEIIRNLNENGTNTSTLSPFSTDSSKNVTPETKSPAPILEVPSLENLEEAMHSMLVESYFGYAVTSGEFYGEASGSYVAASAPRYNSKGAVLVYKSDPLDLVSSEKILGGIQFGEYFGAALCAEDVNNDSYTDLFVGAPLYSDVNADEGRVYVYMGGNHLSDKPDVILKGSGLPFSRFGIVISPVGDVTLDGFKDVVISAPQEDDGKGAIYIFCGGEGKLEAEFAQRIVASSFSNVTFKMFGQSVSGVDVDENGYPDILVGTPGSDTIVVLKTRPVALINVQFDIETPEIDRRNKMCWVKNTTSDESCVRCKVCFSFSGKSVPAGIGIRYEILPDIFQSNPRIAFKESVDNRKKVQHIVYLWEPNLPTCSEYNFYLKKNIPDMMTNLTLKLMYDMEEYVPNATESTELSPVLDAHSKKTHTAATFFKTYCEDTSSCVANISVVASRPISEEGTTVKSYLMSHDRVLRFYLELHNAGPEEAHAVLVKFHFPNVLIFSTITKTTCFQPLSETEESAGENGVSSVSIVLFNTFLGVGDSCSGQLNFLAKPVLSNSRPDSVKFIVNASTVSRDYHLQDNQKTYTVTLEYQTSFRIMGRSYPEVLKGFFTNSTNTSLAATSSFSHVYAILSTGTFLTENVKISIEWPTCTRIRDARYYARHTKTVLWRGRLTERNDTDVVDISNSILLGNDSSICDETNYSGSGVTEITSSDCLSTNAELCPMISIFIEKIFPDQQINFEVFGEIEVSQFKDTEDPVPLVSFIKVEILDQAHLKYSPDQSYQHSLGTTFYPTQRAETSGDVKNFMDIPFWVYIISAVAGILLLIATMWLLRWCGFFESKYAKKKREAEDDLMDGGPESTPMNPTA